MAYKKFSKCPGDCTNVTSGDPIYKCKKCGKMYCKICMPGSRYGNCNTDWSSWGLFANFSTIGYIG